MNESEAPLLGSLMVDSLVRQIDGTASPASYENLRSSIIEYGLWAGEADTHSLLSKMGVSSPEEYLDAWKAASSKIFRTESVGAEQARWIGSNMLRALEVYRFDQSALKILEERFSLRVPVRYPTELLVQQAQNADRRDRGYGLVLTAYDCYNGALANQQWDLTAHKHVRWFPYDIRFVEYRSPEHAKSQLAALSETYGQDNKIQFLIVNEHGIPDDTYDTRVQHRLLQTSTFLEPSFQALLSDALHPQAELVLDSCGSAEHGGYGDRIEQHTGKTVHKRDQNDAILRLRPTKKNGIARLRPTWIENDK